MKLGGLRRILGFCRKTNKHRLPFKRALSNLLRSHRLVYTQVGDNVKLTAGEIYFIGEKDLKSGIDTSYVKIGIVRDGAKGPRTSDERLLEHQTGNPRKLFLRNVITTPAVEEIETRVHRIFAPLRVHGEWLELTEVQYQEALKMTSDMAIEAESSFPALEAAEALKMLTSNSLVIEAPAHVLDIWKELSLAKSVVKACGDALDIIKSTIYQFAVQGETEGIASIQERKGRLIFDVEQFKQENHTLFEKYQVDKSSWQQRFTISKTKEDSDPEQFSPGLQELIRELEMLCLEVKTASDLVNVHSVHVQLLSREARAQWVASLREALLKSILGENEGFEGICKWPRTEKTKKVLDEKKLSEDHPDIFAKFLRESETTQAIVVQPMIGY